MCINLDDVNLDDIDLNGLISMLGDKFNVLVKQENGRWRACSTLLGKGHTPPHSDLYLDADICDGCYVNGRSEHFLAVNDAVTPHAACSQLLLLVVRQGT